MIRRITNYTLLLSIILLISNISFGQDKQILARSYYVKAQENYGEGNNDKAIEYLNQSLDYLGNKTNPRIESLYTQIYNAQKNYIEAEKHIDLYFKKANANSPDYDKLMGMVVDIKEAANSERERVKAREERERKEQEAAQQRQRDKDLQEAKDAKRRKELAPEIAKANKLINEEKYSEAQVVIQQLEEDLVFEYSSDIMNKKGYECFTDYNELKQNLKNIRKVTNYINDRACNNAYTNDLKSKVSPYLIERGDAFMESTNKNDLNKAKTLYNQYLTYSPNGDKTDYVKNQLNTIDGKLNAIQIKEKTKLKKEALQSRKVDNVFLAGANISPLHFGMNYTYLTETIGVSFGFRTGGGARLFDTELDASTNYRIEDERVVLKDDAIRGEVYSSGTTSATIESERSGEGQVKITRRKGDLSTVSFSGNLGLNVQVYPAVFVYGDLGIGYFSTTQGFNNNGGADYYIQKGSSFRAALEFGMGGFIYNKYYITAGLLKYPERSATLSVGFNWIID